jgi:hypothetical protein
MQFVAFLKARGVGHNTVNEHVSVARKVCCFLNGISNAFKAGDHARYDDWLANLWAQVHHAPQHFSIPRGQQTPCVAAAKDLFMLEQSVESYALRCQEEDPAMRHRETWFAIR